MAMYKVTYEIKRGNQQDTKIVLVGAPNWFEAKSAVETSETVAGEWDTHGILLVNHSMMVKYS